MILSLIVAVSENGVIGCNGRIPWRLSSDLKLFRKVTMGHTLIQGRRTYQSIGRPLRGREMVVVTRQQDYQAPGCTVVHSLQEALEAARINGETEAFVSGGAGLYAEALPLADRIYLTRVHAAIAGDTFFPAFEQGDWAVKFSKNYSASEKDDYDFTYQILERKQ